VLFPAFVKVRHDPAELRRLFLLSQGVQCIVVIPIAVGLAMVASEAVEVLLGPKWLPAVPFVQVLALIKMVEAIRTSAAYVLITVGRVRQSTMADWLEIVLFSALAIVVFPAAGAFQLTVLKAVGSLASLGLTLFLLLLALTNITFRDMASTVSRALVAVGAMAVAVSLLPDGAPLPTVILLSMKVVLGVATYASAIALLWVISGRPEGAETYLWSTGNRLLSAWRSTRQR
jgi:O-antigen/teichoic acid export membrane protein